MRFFRRDRSATKLVRSRLSSRKSRSIVSGTKLGFSRPCLHQLSNPLAVFDVRLTSRHILDMGRIGQQQLELSFQQVPEGSPVDSGGFHGHVSHCQIAQPVRTTQNRCRRGAELPDPLLFFSPRASRIRTQTVMLFF